VKQYHIGQFPVLASLWCNDGQSIRDLARSARTSEPTMVRTIDRMQRDGLVTREAGETDRRTVQVRLTDRGRALRELLIPEAREIVDIAIAGIDADQISAFEETAWRMLENLDEWTGTTRSCGRLKQEPETD
jgi:DNA-binding MarR family transcriptional regulator